MTEAEVFEAELAQVAQQFAASFPSAGDFGVADGALDFSKQSIVVLEAALLKLRNASMPSGRLRDVAIGAGAYLAEVIRRRSPVALRWVPASVLPGSPDPDNPFLLATPKNLVVAVLSKPKRLLQNGITDGLVHFAEVVNDLFSREATSRE